MPSGAKEMVISSLERAVSTDINRLQKFSNFYRAELLRALINTSFGSEELQSGGQYLPGSSSVVGTPVSAEVISGLVVEPQLGNFNVLVSPGFVWMLAPDLATDDSPYKEVFDAGVASAGTLVMATNASGSIRIDVIECQLTVNNTLETDNRDIFNPATGAFAPATVTKAVAAQLIYRIRQGTPGSGFPGAALGWLPLAVASVPAGSPASNDAITFWDVRPLISDRVFPPFNKGGRLTRHADIDLVGDAQQPGAGALLIAGQANVVPYDSVNAVPSLRRLGGIIQRGTPGTDNVGGFAGFDGNDAANQSSAFTAGSLNYIYLVEAGGLPRWSRYTDAASGSRVPRSPKGIPVITNIAPVSSYFAEPSSAIPLPASTGLGIAATMGCCIGALNYGGSVLGNFLTRRGQSTNEAFGRGGTIAPSNFAAGAVTWALTPGTTHPIHAAFVNVTVTLGVSVPANSIAQATINSSILDNLGNNLQLHPNVNEVYSFANPTAALTVEIFTIKVRVPLDSPQYPSQQIEFFGTFTGGASFSAGNNLLTVTGFGT